MAASVGREVDVVDEELLAAGAGAAGEHERRGDLREVEAGGDEVGDGNGEAVPLIVIRVAVAGRVQEYRVGVVHADVDGGEGRVVRLQAHVHLGPRAEIARHHPVHAEAPPG